MSVEQSLSFFEGWALGSFCAVGESGTLQANICSLSKLLLSFFVLSLPLPWSRSEPSAGNGGLGQELVVSFGAVQHSTLIIALFKVEG